MSKFFNTQIGRLRLITFLEGLSLILLVIIAMPLKYIYNNPTMVEILGPIHGGLFILFVIYIVKSGMDNKWNFKETVLMALIAAFIPFGTFYFDHRFLSRIQAGEINALKP